MNNQRISIPSTPSKHSVDISTPRVAYTELHTYPCSLTRAGLHLAKNIYFNSINTSLNPSLYHHGSGSQKKQWLWIGELCSGRGYVAKYFHKRLVVERVGDGIQNIPPAGRQAAPGGWAGRRCVLCCLLHSLADRHREQVPNYAAIKSSIIPVSRQPQRASVCQGNEGIIAIHQNNVKELRHP